MVSVLILTYNEQDNLPRCLESVAWSDDVLVLDSFSTDRTTAIARDGGARVQQRSFGHFAGQRNFGLEHGALRHDWVLHLDADEVVPPGLRDELISIARNPSASDAYRVASKMIFRERWLRYSGMYPTYQVRFGRCEKLRFRMVGHGQRETLPPEVVATLREPLLHYSFSKGLDDWWARHQRYAAAEAAENLAVLAGHTRSLAALFAADRTARRRALKELSVRLPCRPAMRFIYMYLIRLGFLDGAPGWEYCRMLAGYESMIVAQLRALRAKH